MFGCVSCFSITVEIYRFISLIEYLHLQRHYYCITSSAERYVGENKVSESNIYRKSRDSNGIDQNKTIEWDMKTKIWKYYNGMWNTASKTY